MPVERVKPDSDPHTDDNGLRLEKVWDPLTRVWHWLLALTVTCGWLLGEYRDFDTIAWHMYFGYTTGTLVVLRLVRGCTGPAPVRLEALLPGPAALVACLRTIT